MLLPSGSAGVALHGSRVWPGQWQVHACLQMAHVLPMDLRQSAIRDFDVWRGSSGRARAVEIPRQLCHNLGVFPAVQAQLRTSQAMLYGA